MMEEIDWRCADCSTSLPVNHRDPCPECGSVERDVTAKATLEVNLSAEARAEVELGTTSRATTVLDTADSPAYQRVKGFANWLSTEAASLTWDELLDESDVASQVKTEVAQCRSESLRGTLWRARRFAPDESPKGVDDLGPPPQDKAQAYRFNEDSDPVLYCGRVRRILPEEVPANEGKPDLWVQRFDVDAPNVGVLDLDQDLRDECPLLHNLLFLAERQAKEDDVYRLTQFVRSLCKREDILAVEYPSVAGGYADDPDALNVAVFDEGIERVMASATGEPRPFEDSD